MAGEYDEDGSGGGTSAPSGEEKRVMGGTRNCACRFRTRDADGDGAGGGGVVRAGRLEETKADGDNDSATDRPAMIDNTVRIATADANDGAHRVISMVFVSGLRSGTLLTTL
mmetsp:Transcript_22518/g.45122  ORF Transcript_22518/g.45122 Transcript_22518/m.45122 type:complete len:112 (-) Transcript_22518:56-391(-)